MKRSTIMRRGLFLSVLAVVVPFALTGAIGWFLTIHSAQTRLTTLAQIASERANITFEQASQALKNIALTDLPPCSPEGIDQMRMVAMNTFSIESVGYEEDVFACTSWGATRPKANTWPEDFTTDDGVKVSIDVQSDSDLIKPMLALQYAAFTVLVDPEQFREVALDEGIRVAVGTKQGRVLGPTPSQHRAFPGPGPRRADPRAQGRLSLHAGAAAQLYRGRRDSPPAPAGQPVGTPVVPASDRGDRRGLAADAGPACLAAHVVAPCFAGAGGTQA